MSLSGYEENPNEDTTQQEQTITEESTDMTQSSLDEAVSYGTPSSEHLDLGHHESELDLSSLTISPSHSTPRPTAYQKGKAAQLGDETPSSAPSYPSGYGEGYRDEASGVGHEEATLPHDDDGAPVTPGRHVGRYLPHNASAEIPMSSPFIPPPTITRNLPSTSKKPNLRNYQKPTDPVLHHVLDKTYRVQATPLSKGYKPTKFSVNTPKDNQTSTGGHRPAYDDSPMSSPELEAPKLHKELFGTRGSNIHTTPGTDRKARGRSSPQKRTPKPGISVLTPAKSKLGKKNSWESDEEGDAFDLDDDDDDIAAALGFSPPKTMQFYIPQSRLMKTPGMFLVSSYGCFTSN